MALMACSAVSFIPGAFMYLRPHKPLYASMIVLGTGCMMLGRAYTDLRVIAGLPVSGIFHAGILGTVGAFAFFFSSNYGQIDSLVDDGSDSFMKYRAMSLSAPVITALMYLYILNSPAPRPEKISDGLAAAAIAAASYFHFKHIFIPDVDYGVVRCLRGFNVLALLYGILCMLEMTASAYNYHDLAAAVFILQCAVTLALVPIMHKGVKDWSK